MATSPNFGWLEPDNTDLVKNGALAIRTAVNAIDASMADLKGGTTGQVLAKASNTDMDFSWVADATGIPATIFDAKGDIIAASAADTASRLAVGTNGQVLTADSTTTTGLKWATAASNGGWTSLGSGSLSSNILTLSSISADYKDLRLIVKNAQVASTTDLIVTINSLTSLDYIEYRASNTTTNNNAVTNVTSWYLNNNLINTGSNGNISVLDFPNYSETSGYKIVSARSRIFANSQSQQFMAQAAILTSSAISEIVFKTGGANFTGGTYEIWGIK